MKAKEKGMGNRLKRLETNINSGFNHRLALSMASNEAGDLPTAETMGTKLQRIGTGVKAISGAMKGAQGGRGFARKTDEMVAAELAGYEGPPSGRAGRPASPRRHEDK